MPLYTGVEVFPPIGVARAGDSKEHYLASEDPDNEHPRKNFKFRGPDGKIKPSVSILSVLRRDILMKFFRSLLSMHISTKMEDP